MVNRAALEWRDWPEEVDMSVSDALGEGVELRDLPREFSLE